MKFYFSNKETFLHELFQIFFRIFLLAFVITFIIEYIEPGFVSNWFNPVWLLIIAVTSGIVVIIND